MSERSASASDGGAATERARLEAAVAARRAELDRISRASAPGEWAVAQLRLGEALQRLARACEYDDDVLDLHGRAREAFEAALEESERLAPLDRAAARIHLGGSLIYGFRWERAVEHCREATGAVSHAEAPELWGMAQRHFAAVLMKGPDEHGPRNPRGNHFLPRFEAAVQAGRAAVSAIREPVALAEARTILARALTAFGKQSEDAGLVDEAIAIGRALTARPEPAAPAAVSVAMELLTALKAFADRHEETPLREAWALGVQGVCNFLDDADRDRLLGEVRACIGEHGTPDMRLAWAYGAWDHVRKLKDLAETSRVLDDLKGCAIDTTDPRVRNVWVQATCGALKQRAYCEANLDRARSQLAEIKPREWSSINQFWPEAAATIHAVLLSEDPTAAGALRTEMRAVAETTGWLIPWRTWMAATVNTIKEIRWTDYAGARALYAEIAAVGGTNQAHDRERSLADARTLLQDREVKLAHGIVDEVLKPLELAPQATATGDNLRVSRLDASKAPSLETVGQGIYCREMNLTGTAIEALPDDLQVTQRLDVSLCRHLKRLPAGLKVGQLAARECTALEELPPGLEVSYLDLTGCTALKALPADLVVRRGRLSLRGCERLTALPAGIGPIAQLDLSGCLNVVALPPGLVVTAWIDVGGSGLTALPPRLEGIAIRWRGVPVDARIAFRPETLDIGEILAETNAERRRVMMERFGLDRFMSEADARVLDEDRDAGGPRRLLGIELPGDEPLVCVSVICPSTHRQFMLRVPPTVTTCRQAVAWTAGFDNPDDYRPIVET